MANLQERRDKSGKLISYSIRVHRGRGADGKQLKPWTATFEVSPTWTEKSARKKAEAFAATFEKECREGVTSDSRLKFEEYCNYVIDLKEQRGIKHSTIVRYKELAVRIYPAIGHIKLKDLRADHLNSFYTDLAKPGQNKRTGEVLSPKTILEHHRLISTVLDQAEKEGLVPFNVAAKATLPKVSKKEVNYFQPEQVAAIRDALDAEPLKWKTLTHLLLITGARRGEVLGLKWSSIDFERKSMTINHKVTEQRVNGKYVPVVSDVMKNKTSCRTLPLIPAVEAELLKQKEKQQLYRRLFGKSYRTDYLDFVCTDQEGKLLRPNFVTEHFDWLLRKYSLPRIRFHDLRHSCASLMVMNGVSMKQVQEWLGHSTFSTTADIYAHLDYKSKEGSAGVIAGLLETKK